MLASKFFHLICYYIKQKYCIFFPKAYCDSRKCTEKAFAESRTRLGSSRRSPRTSSRLGKGEHPLPNPHPLNALGVISVNPSSKFFCVRPWFNESSGQDSR